ncbi:M81 family metallopeptidase [Chelatococcus sp. SYSU_G07232]|uniref:Microcystinase C n=1 Tax=Chelatococcus albus TaxID=3047466 RepID=A0ABT7AKP1_9HYPH|nr:M81 family metallopeptidase [Chelatococcus sp. SYSU_G07232]MDJ1159176.1 M81 family metallopeptidase [Chelatococcus sp. SYSU_G07232]
MRFLIAMMKHETNTFSPVPTPIERFARGRGVPLSGEEALKAYRGTGSGIGGFIAVADREGAEIVCPLAAEAWPSGLVEDAAYDTMCGMILDAVRAGGLDGIMLDLHGAMVTESHEDGEGTLIERIRAIDPATPIAVALDMHANVYPAVIAKATVVCGYQTYPHLDQFETGQRAGDILVRAIRGEIRPVMAWGNNPMLPHVMKQGTHEFPNRELQAKCVAFERQGALAASLFVGFPHADIREAGLSAVVVTDGDAPRAAAMRDELLDDAWRARKDFVFAIEPLREAVARAKALPPGEGPIVLLDHYDNAASGGTMDTTPVLAEILRQGLEDVAIFAICDPAAVAQAIAAGHGATVTLSLGGKMAMPAIRRASPPLDVTGVVKTITDGHFRNLGPMSKGVEMRMGPTIVLDTGRAEIVVISEHQEPNDEAAFLSVGIDPRRKRFVMLKSRVHWRAGLGHVAREIIPCAGVGVCTSDYGEITFRNVRRPIYPLDADAARPMPAAEAG